MKRTVYWIVIVSVFALFLHAHGLAVQMEEVICEEEAATEEVFLFESESEEVNLAEGYINKRLFPQDGRGLLRAPRLIGSRLTGIDRQIYLDLYDGVLEIAAGVRESTVFAFSFGDLYEQRTFSIEELGVEAITINGVISQNAIDKARNMMAGPAYSSINQALLADCPYELYWFNKAEGGMKISTRRSYQATSKSLTINGTITISMTVSLDYAKGPYIMDTSYGQSVSNAVLAANTIVSQYSDYSGAAKMRAFLNEICNRTAYHAKAGKGNLPYGNPWQLIWVFDGDPKTMVTCEGYSKAFQYLCDLSSDDISVISVAGTMNGVNHMWNIASMEDGKNYLIDVTNCDSGMAGFPDKLFLVGAKDGNVSDGYRFSSDYYNLTYRYTSETLFTHEELKIAYWNYEEGGPPIPEFQATSTELYENEDITFTYLNAGYAYDELIAEISYLNLEEEVINQFEETIQLQEGESIWEYKTDSLCVGSYSFRFTGFKDGTFGDWTAPINVHVADIGEMIPTYQFSTDVGYTGYQVVIRLNQQAQGIYVLETGEEYLCQGRDVLLPMGEPGVHEYSIALIWNGKSSAYGATKTVEVREALGELNGLRIPAETRQIEDEAFRGISATAVIIPDSIETIGKYAFADNENLLWVEIGSPEADVTAFDNCPNAVFHPSEADWGFTQNVPFVK